MKFGDDRFLTVIRNITEQKKRSEQTIRSHRLESLGIFAGGLANDFNNILSTIIGSISLVRMKIGEDEQILSLLDDVDKASIRGGRLARQLLSLSHGDEPVKQISDITEVVMESADFTISGTNTAINFSISPDIRQIEIDRAQIGQVIQNIVLNASQSMPSGGIIAVSIKNERLGDNNSLSLPQGDYIVIGVKDGGNGIETKNLKRIFDPYFTTKNNANGLGLTISQDIVNKHGGAISVKSEEEKGSVVSIYLPAPVEKKSEKGSQPGPGQGRDIKNLSIIIMDDEPQLRRIMEILLKDEGAKIYPVSEGGEAIDLFEKMAASDTPVDLIIADLTIPGGMGGMEAVRIIREQGIPFKAIVISGYSNDPVLSDFKSYGFDGFIAKPFSSEELLSVVKNVLNGRS